MTACYQNVSYAKNPLLPKIKNAIHPLMHSHKGRGRGDPKSCHFSYS